MNLSEQEKAQLRIAQDNIEYFNFRKKKGLLTLEFDDGSKNKCRLLKDGKVILSYATIEAVLAATTVLNNYERR